MEIKVGIQHVARELTVETEQSADEVEQGLQKALTDGSLLTLLEPGGRKIVVPADKIAYLDLGKENARRVGFGAV